MSTFTVTGNVFLDAIIEIFIACILVFVVERLYLGWRERVESQREKKLDLGCDYCEELRSLYRTPDKLFYLCRTCMEAYLKENDFSESEKQKVRDKYKVRPPKRIMPKKKKGKVKK